MSSKTMSPEKMSPEKFLTWYHHTAQDALRARRRCLVVLSGDIEWSISLLKLIPGCPFSDNLSSGKSNSFGLDNPWHIYSAQPHFEGSVNHQNFRHQLGTESSHVVFYDHALNIDAFAALSGTLVAGGFLFLLWPQQLLPPYQQEKSAFLTRFFQRLAQNDQHTILLKESPSAQLNEDNHITAKVTNTTTEEKRAVDLEQELTDSLGCATPEQLTAVHAIMRVVTGHRDRPLVLTADRGRGKSSALAIACSQLLSEPRDNKLQIIITAPNYQALGVFFKQLSISLPSAMFNGHQVDHENGAIVFMPMDQLLKHSVTPSLVLVDEAAAIPVYLLTQLVQRFHRLVFSSTVHGYEGAGRGFTLKFQQILQHICPQWRALHLNQPIRWCEHDPLERFVFDVCLLDAKLTELNFDETSATSQDPFISSNEHQSCEFVFSELVATELLESEHLLKQIFSVLVTAHYQTSPSDLRMMLDNPHIKLVTASRQNQVVAVVLLLREGQVSSAELGAVKQNQRRLRNQFIPQSLMTHCGLEQGFNYRYFRIMRIAVHPSCQQRHIGRTLLTKLTEIAQRDQVDFLGASFGANSQLLHFWLSSDYQIARIGFTQDQASGEHSALVLKAVNRRSEKFLLQINKQFYRTFEHLLVDEFSQLPPSLVWLILHHCPAPWFPELTTEDEQSVRDFYRQQRQFSCCVYGLHRWLLQQMQKPFEPKFSALICRILQKQSITEVCHHHQFSGKKALLSHMISTIKDHVEII